MVAVLTLTGLFVGLRLRADLDDAVEASLRARSDALAAAGPSLPGGQGGGDAEERFAQLIGVDGRVRAVTGEAEGAALSRSEVRGVLGGEEDLVVERQIPGVDGTQRVLARPLGGAVLAVGQSLEDRDEAVGGLLTSLAVGGALAVVLASVLGYGLATAALAPIEAMRRRAAAVSLGPGEERLPLPQSHDEVRRLGETLNAMLDRLDDGIERERRFVADASHELRTPLAVIRAELDATLRSGDAGREARVALAAALDECDRLAQLADDLLVLARTADGRLPLRRETVEARALLEGVRARYADRAAEHGRRISLTVPDGLRLDADPQLLRQALGNLVDNALRHGAGEVVLSARRDGGGVALEIADDGPGFSDTIAGRAFERFARGDEARSAGGAGLGLAIVRGIAEAHDGHAGLTPGRLAAVRIWFPAKT